MDNAIARDPAGSDLGRRGPALPGRAGVRVRHRGGGVRPAVLPWPGAVQLGTPADEPVPLVRAPGRAERGHGVRDRDVLADPGRLVGRADRGGGSGHRRAAASCSPGSRPTSCTWRAPGTGPVPTCPVSRPPSARAGTRCPRRGGWPPRCARSATAPPGGRWPGPARNRRWPGPGPHRPGTAGRRSRSRCPGAMPMPVSRTAITGRPAALGDDPDPAAGWRVPDGVGHEVVHHARR